MNSGSKATLNGIAKTLKVAKTITKRSHMVRFVSFSRQKHRLFLLYPGNSSSSSSPIIVPYRLRLISVIPIIEAPTPIVIERKVGPGVGEPGSSRSPAPLM